MRVSVVALLIVTAALAQGRPEATELVFRVDDHRDETLAILEKRLARAGLARVALQPVGEGRFSATVPARDRDKLDRIKQLITQPGKLEFRITVEKDTPAFQRYRKHFRGRAEVIAPADLTEEDRARYPKGLRWVKIDPEMDAKLEARGTSDRLNAWMLVGLDAHDVTGDDLHQIVHSRDAGGIGKSWAIYFRVKKDAQARMAALTTFEEDKYMAIILDGRVLAAPILRCQLTDSAQITGGYTEDTARTLAAILQAGSLKHRPLLVSERTVAAK